MTDIIQVPTTCDSSDAPRRRKASADALTGREAAILVRELNRQLGLWQSMSVKLYTMAQRLSASGRSDPSVGEQVRDLLATVATEAARFETIIGTQPPTVAEHSRIGDTRRSFEMIGERLRTSLRLLGLEPRSK